MNLITAAVSIAASGDNTVIAAASGVSYRIRRLVLTNAVATAQAVTVKDGASTSLTGAIAFPTAVGGQPNFGDNQDAPLFVTTRGNAFVLNLLNATSVTGFVQYSAE